uniref:Uncharacterized protein n=1 Tax=Rhabditophanes sp. KR3021 TaxID=114890 RepID=A0AC35U399_9BILA
MEFSLVSINEINKYVNRDQKSVSESELIQKFEESITKNASTISAKVAIGTIIGTIYAVENKAISNQAFPYDLIMLLFECFVVQKVPNTMKFDVCIKQLKDWNNPLLTSKCREGYINYLWKVFAKLDEQLFIPILQTKAQLV